VVLRIFVVDYVFLSRMGMTSPIHHCSSSDPSGSVEVAEGGEQLVPLLSSVGAVALSPPAMEAEAEVGVGLRYTWASSRAGPG
jgi:hypothetical protein